MIYQRRTAVRVNEKVYMKVVGPTTMYGFETMAPTKRQQAEVEGSRADVKTFIDRNEYIRGTAQVF